MPSFLVIPEDAESVDDAVKYKFDDPSHILDHAIPYLKPGKSTGGMLNVLNLQQTPDRTWEIIFFVDHIDHPQNQLASKWFPLAKIHGPVVLIEGEPYIRDGEIEINEPLNFDHSTMGDESKGATRNGLLTDFNLQDVDTSRLRTLLDKQLHGTLVYTDGSYCKWPCDKQFGNSKDVIDNFVTLGYMLFCHWDKDNTGTVNEKATKLYGRKTIKGDAMFTLQINERVVSIDPDEIEELYNLRDNVVSMSEIETLKYITENTIKNRFTQIEICKKELAKQLHKHEQELEDQKKGEEGEGEAGEAGEEETEINV